VTVTGSSGSVNSSSYVNLALYGPSENSLLSTSTGASESNIPPEDELSAGAGASSTISTLELFL
jgi:hypothetical protein